MQGRESAGWSILSVQTIKDAGKERDPDSIMVTFTKPMDRGTETNPLEMQYEKSTLRLSTVRELNPQFLSDIG